jgi:predicted transcriptional regulator of viral defense system
VSDKQLSTELIANHIYMPSYISMSSALRYYGLIPETVYITQSMTIKHSRQFDTPVGLFSYLYVPREVFHIGLTNIVKSDFSFIIATPEKALCDLIANSSKVSLRYMNEARQYLENDIRIDMDAFHQMNPTIFREYTLVGKKSGSILTMLKLLQQK